MPTVKNNNAPREVALVFPFGPPHLERIKRGILNYAEQHGPWRFAFRPEATSADLDGLQQWKGDGVIGMLESEKQIEQALQISTPLVSVASAVKSDSVATVTVDNRLVGRLVARYFIERGFRRFGFYGVSDLHYSRERLAGFAETIRDSGYELTSCEDRRSQHNKQFWRTDHKSLRAWLSKLDSPVAVFAAHDSRATIVLDLCRQLGLKVPGEVAVVGVDDDRIVCEGSRPALTSVRPNGEELGYQAAKLLDQLMRGGQIPKVTGMIAPVGITERDSSAFYAIKHPLMEKAVRLIQKDLARGINVAETAEKIGTSRRWLERRFICELNCTPHHFISRLRIDQAKMMLAKDSFVELKKIAKSCGFSEVRRLQTVFESLVGESIGNYRKRWHS